jgi:hypothetical protein
MLPCLVDRGFHVAGQDDELRGPAVIIAAKAHDVDAPALLRYLAHVFHHDDPHNSLPLRCVIRHVLCQLSATCPATIISTMALQPTTG